MSIAGGPDIVENGLVLHLDAADTNSYPGSGTLWTDLSGNGYSGTLTNGPTFSSSNRGSILFDGVNDYIDHGTSPASSIRGGTQFTIGFWTKKIASNKDTLAGAWYHSTRNGFYLQWYTDNIIYFGNASGGLDYNTSSLIWTNNWYYLVGVFDGSQATNSTKGKIYVNGSLVSLSSANLTTTTVSTYAANFYIGALETYTSYANSYIANTFLYNRALSVTEILQNYNATKGRYEL